MPPSRPARQRLLALGVAALTALALASVATTPAAAAPTASPAPAPTTEVHYAVSRPLCNAPADPALMRCYGLKRVDVPKGTPGAYRYRTLAANGTGAGAAHAGVGAGPAGGYTPVQLATAYGYNPRVKRADLTVAIVLWHDAPTVLRDLNHFDRKYGLKKETSRSFRKVNQHGRTSPLPQRDRGSASEIALDTQAVRAVCNTCRILLVEADGPYDSDLAAAVNTAVRLGADVVTNSYGTPERRFSAKVRNAYRHPGVGMVVSTGDSGWLGWDYVNSPHYVADAAPSFPSTSPYVIAVGGTSLHLDAQNRRVTETVWNSNGDHDATGSTLHRPMGASGGGCSSRFPAPAWQRRTPGYAAAQCNGHRLAADMAMVADPATGFAVYDTYGSGGWVTIGGTSLSAPLAAGMLALAGGSRGARYPASALYGNSSARPWTRFDVTTGGNGFCGADTPGDCSSAVLSSSGLRTQNPNNTGLGVVDCSFPRNGSDAVPATSRSECSAARGLDGPSGVGTPRSSSLFRRTDPYLGVRYAGTIRHHRPTTFRARIKTPVSGTAITSLTWKWGDRRTLVVRTGSVKHTYRTAGRYTITLTSRDSRGQLVVLKKKITVR